MRHGCKKSRCIANGNGHHVDQPNTCSFSNVLILIFRIILQAVIQLHLVSDYEFNGK